MNPPSSPASYRPDSWRCTFLPPSTWCPSRPRALQGSAENRPQCMCCKHTCDTLSCTVLCVTHFESPEGVARVGASVEKAAGFCSCAQQVLGWEALCLRDVTNLRGENKTGGGGESQWQAGDKCKNNVTYISARYHPRAGYVSECHLRDSCEKLKCNQVTALVKLPHVLKHDLYMMQKTHFPPVFDTLTTLPRGRPPGNASVCKRRFWIVLADHPHGSCKRTVLKKFENAALAFSCGQRIRIHIDAAIAPPLDL